MALLRRPFLILLWLFATACTANNPVWSYSGNQSIAAYKLDSTYLMRFGFTYKGGQLSDIILIISRNEKPGQGGGERSPQFTFTKEVEKGKTVWRCKFDWKGTVQGKTVPFVAGHLSTGTFSVPQEGKDKYLNATLTWYPGPHYYEGDKNTVQGALFSFLSTD